MVEFALPNAAEIQTEIERLLAATNNSLPNQVLNELIRSAQGLSMERIRRVLSRANRPHVENYKRKMWN